MCHAMVGGEKITSPPFSQLNVQSPVPPFFNFFSPFVSLSSPHWHPHTKERETETEEKAWERERERERERTALLRRRRRRRKRWVSGKLRPVGINSSDQRSFVVQSSWNLAERFTTREYPLWMVEIRIWSILQWFSTPWTVAPFWVRFSSNFRRS